MALTQSNFNEEPRVAAPNEPHLACVLLLDTSGSMSGEPIESLNRGISNFIKQTSMDEMAKKRVDVAIIAFDDEPRLEMDFTPISQMEPIRLTTGGRTSMGAAINMAIDKVKERNRFYASLGTQCFKPWIFMITDGAPTDDITAAAQRIQEEENKGSHGKLKFWALGVGDYDKKTLHTLTKRVMELENTDFSAIFNWLSESMCAISVSRVGENVQLGNLPKNAHVVPPDWNN
ncbi:MAG: VWA domain-containing protein [Lachnospiraceae bacterium]|nr:VWA domain-containing protein [Lachnospiraceae bacterium]